MYFEDDDERVTNELSVMQNNTLNKKSYWMPDVHETVVCLFLMTGQESGIIIGSIYSDADKPPNDIVSGKERTGIWIDGKNYIKWVEESKEFVVRTENPVRFEVSPPWEDDY